MVESVSQKQSRGGAVLNQSQRMMLPQSHTEEPLIVDTRANNLSGQMTPVRPRLLNQVSNKQFI